MQNTANPDPSRNRSKSVTTSNQQNILSLSAFEQIFGSLTSRPIVPILALNNNPCRALEPCEFQPLSLHLGDFSIIERSNQPCKPEVPCQKAYIQSIPQLIKSKPIGVQTQRVALNVACSQTQIGSKSLDRQLSLLEIKENQLAVVKQNIQYELQNLNDIKEEIAEEREQIQRQWDRIQRTEMELNEKKKKIHKEYEDFQAFRLKTLIRRMRKIFKKPYTDAFSKIWSSYQVRNVQRKIRHFYEASFTGTATVNRFANSKQKFIQNYQQLEFSFKNQIASQMTPLVQQNCNLSNRIPRKRVVDTLENEFDKQTQEITKEYGKKNSDFKGIVYPLNYKK